MPAWVVFVLVVLNMAQAVGWAFTIRKSMERAAAMYNRGRQDEVENYKRLTKSLNRAKRKKLRS